MCGVTILFSSFKGSFISKIIQSITSSSVSHVAIGFYDSTLDQHLVLESWWFGFRITHYDQWIKTNCKVAEFFLPKYNFNNALRELARNIGTKYEYKTFILAGLDSLLSRIGIQLKPVQTPNKYICSEAVLRLLKSANVPSVMHLENEATDPGELYRIAQCDPDFVEI